MTESSLLADLQAIVGPDHVRQPAGDNKFIVHGLAPQAIAHPGTYEEVAAVLRYANERGTAVIPFGHGTKNWVGNLPSRYDIALSLSRLNEIVEYESADLTITCQAGVEFDRVRDTLSPNGQMVPVGPSSSSCIGALLACNTARNLQYGAARDYTIGMRVVTADGRLTQAGGKVVKNVAGYDLCKLYTGSLGTLGVIVEATFKLVPSPQAEDLIQMEFRSLGQACAFAVELHRRSISLWQIGINRTMVVEDTGHRPLGPYGLFFFLSGTTAAVERSHREIAQLTSEMGPLKFDPQDLPPRNQADWVSDDPLLIDICVLPSQIPALIAELDLSAPGAHICASPIEGTLESIWCDAGGDEDLLRTIRATVASFGGTVIIARCDPDLKRRIDVFGDVPPKTLDLMRRVKQQFDPNGILSPGRFVGRL